MSDLISRQAAIDFIDAGHLVNPNEPRWSDNEVVNFLKSRPSAQPEIIRCKDCKHQEKFFHEDKRRKEGGYYIFGCDLASEYSHVCLDEDFCSRAERREE